MGALVKQPETFWAVVNFLTVPLLFTSSALFPLEFVPPWLRTIAYLNPVTYAIDSIRALMIGGAHRSDIAGGVAVVVLFSTIVAGISTAIFARRVELSTDKSESRPGGRGGFDLARDERINFSNFYSSTFFFRIHSITTSRSTRPVCCGNRRPLTPISAN